MEYRTATETVIEMPSTVRPPATSVCFPIWNLVNQSRLPDYPACIPSVLDNRRQIQNCENFLLRQPIYSLLNDITIDPKNLTATCLVRRPSINGSAWATKADVLKGSRSSEYLTGFYKGPYKCLRFASLSLDSDILSIDRMTTGYPRGMLSFREFHWFSLQVT